MGLAAIGPCCSLFCPFSLFGFPGLRRAVPAVLTGALRAAASIMPAVGRTAGRIGSSLPVAPLGDDLAPPPLRILLFRQGLMAALEGVGAGAQLDAKWRPLELEGRLELVLQ